MNTQTHMLLACTVLIPAASMGRLDGLASETARFAANKLPVRPGVRSLTFAALAGALVPDAGLFVMWGLAKLQGVPDSVIWSEWYYSSFWQQVGAVTNSLPVFFLMAMAAWWAGGRVSSGVQLASRHNSRYLPDLALVFAMAALLHALTDFPLHHDDGHPHFWPFTHWIFSSPVSYWDPSHYGRVWSLIEVAIALLLIVILWRRFSSRITRVFLVHAGLSYFLVTVYWMTAF